MNTIYYCRWLFTPNGEVLENAAVSVCGSTIVDANVRSKITRHAGDRIVNLGNVLLLPGFINIHTHLEDSVIRGNYRDPEESFAAYSAKKSTRLKQIDDAAVAASIRLNARELLSRGITTVVDSSRKNISPIILATELIRSWVIHELHPEEKKDEDEIIQGLKKKIEESSGKVKPGIGPHALYSLSEKGHRTVIDYAIRNRLPWSIHIAESAEEVQAFSEQSGDLFFLLSRRRPWEFEKVSHNPLRFALDHNLIPDYAMCYHCNYADGTDIALLAEKHASMVVCPTYSEVMGHKAFPVDVAMNRGVRICVGTESIADSNSSNLFDELFLLKTQYAHIPATDLIKWVTQNPADALHAGELIGSIAPGKLADMIGIGFPGEPGRHVLEELIQTDQSIRFVMVNGEEVLAGY